MTPRSRWGAGVAQWQFSDDVEQELWDVLGSNPALHPGTIRNKVLPLTTQCVCIDLIVVIDCVVCTCNDSVGPQKSSLWLSGSPCEIR